MRTLKLDRSNFIVKGSVRVSDKQSDAIAYIYSRNERLFMQVFVGKQAKPIAHFWYKTSEQRERAVVRLFESRRASIRAKAEYKGKRLAPNLLVVGDILTASWGYDQTNVDAYEVIEARGQYVTVRKIGMATEDTGHMSGRCVPQSGQFIGEPIRKLVQYGTSVTIDDVRTASRWNTSNVAGVAVGPSLHWSSYH